MQDFDLAGLFGDLEPTDKEKAKALAAALRGERDDANKTGALGALGMLTGDSVLGRFGGAQMKYATDAGESADRRGTMLTQALGQRAQQLGEDRRLKLTLGAKEKEADAAKTSKLIDVEGDLRNKYLDNAGTKNVMQSKDFYAQIVGAPANGAGDLSMIYGLAKLWDPGGRVTDSDAANAAKTGGLPGQLQGYFNELTAKGTLSPAARAQMKTEAKRLFGERVAGHKPFRDSFTGLATQYGVNPAHVVIPLGFEDTPPVAEPTPEGMKWQENKKTGERRLVPK